MERDLYKLLKKSENQNFEKLEILLKKSIDKYTFLSADDFDVLKTKKPVLSHLLLQTVKKSIFEMVKTALVVTGFNSLYGENDIN